jgi:O-antigen/teichoic acid export membrane protein
VALVSRFGIGGVALGTAVPALMFQGVFTSFLLRRTGLAWRDQWRAVILPTAAPALEAFWPLPLILWHAGAQSLAVPLVLVACVVLYFVLFWTRSLDLEERQAILLQVTRRLRG